LGKEAKTEIRGSDGSKFEEESMWQGKPITSWSLEEKNIFFDKLKGREIEGLANYFGTAGFFSIQNFMERELPEVWNQYLYETHGNVWLSTKGWKRYDVILNAMLDLDNLLAFLLEHTEWHVPSKGRPLCRGSSSLKNKLKGGSLNGLGAGVSGDCTGKDTVHECKPCPAPN